ncbi:MAG: hypothetical protein QNK59_04825 [Flavobacteriales bacterium]|tara:strand:- start:4524 stop:5021 length:498 start_codon:yes stop_codon:yes gene_type:complete
MKNNLLRLACCALLLSSCAVTNNVSWWNLPKTGSIDLLTSQRGALIVDASKRKMVGELLYIDRYGVVFCETKRGVRVEVAPRVYQEFKLHAMRPSVTTAKWSATTSPLLLLAHGWFSAITAPLSIVNSGLNFYSENHAYGLKMSGLPVEHIRAHCRFPMGIPENY